MNQPCYYHPTSGAGALCIQCGIPLCQDCVQTVQDRAACKNCVGMVRSRFEQQAASSAYRDSPNYAVPPPTMNNRYSAPDVSAAPPTEAKDLLLGILFAFFIGLVGSILTMKILFYAHFGLSLLYVFVGYGVGYGLWKATGRGGAGLALTAVGIMALCLAVAHLVYTYDVVQELSATEKGVDIPVLAVFPIVIKNFGFMHWVCIALGLGACWRSVEGQEN